MKSCLRATTLFLMKLFGAKMTGRKTILIEISQSLADEMSRLASDSRKLLNPFYEEIIKTGLFFYKKSCPCATRMFFDCHGDNHLCSRRNEKGESNIWDEPR